MKSYKIIRYHVDQKKGHNHLFVEFNLDGEKKEVRFDANHLPTTEAELDDYFAKWIVAYEAGKATTTPPAGFEKLVNKTKTIAE